MPAVSVTNDDDGCWRREKAEQKKAEMGEQLRFIVQQLKKEPFNRNYNLISFDSLEPLQLLQILNDILSEIDPKQKIDIREETPDQTAIRIFDVLRILKYKPAPDGSGLLNFRTGLVEGDKPVIYPVLEWLLQRLDDLKKRAYLSRFLVKITIPIDIKQEEHVSEIYQQYEELIEEFKELHKQLEQLKGSSFNTMEIRRDISQMEEEKEQLLKRIERLKRKVESHPNAQAMMAVARNLHQERNQEKKLAEQQHKQNDLIHQADQRMSRLQQQLRNIRQSRDITTPKDVLKRIEEELKTNKYLVKEQQSKEIQEKQKSVQDVQRVVSAPTMGQSDLEQLRDEVADASANVNQLIEKRRISSDVTDDKLYLFRQQASIIARKKEEKADELQRIRDELSKTYQELEEKRHIVKETGAGEVLKGDEFKRYVSKLRSKSTIYKKKRTELAELRAEHGVLSRTEELLKQKNETINQQLSTLEARKGIAGYRATQEELEKVSSAKGEVDEMKGKTLEEISEMVKQLTIRTEQKKGALAPIIKELRPLRQRCQELTEEYEEKKSTYEKQSANLETQRSKLEQEVRMYQEECSTEESRYHYLNVMVEMAQDQQKKVGEEMKSYMSSDPQDKKKTLRELYTKKIQEQENLGKNLREKKKFIQDNHGPSLKQMKMWKDLSRILECKQQCFNKRRKAEAQGNSVNLEAPKLHEEDRLVL